MHKIAALLVLLAACATSDPVEEESPASDPVRAYPINPITDAPPGVTAAMEIVRAAWGERLGVELPSLPFVTWYTYAPGRTTCLHYENFMEGHCVQGLYQTIGGKGMIQILKDGWWSVSIGHTHLAHEMLHWALDEAGGGANAAHDDLLWDDIGEVSALITEAGL